MAAWPASKAAAKSLPSVARRLTYGVPAAGRMENTAGPEARAGQRARQRRLRAGGLAADW